MSQSSTSNRVSLRRIRVAGAVVLALLLAALAFFTWQGDVVLDQRGVPATAQVISVRESSRGAVTATVRFSTADGRTITTTTRPGGLADPPPPVGSTIPIVYDPQDPQAMVRDPRAPQDVIPWRVALAAVGVAGVGALVLLVRKRLTRRAAADAGRPSEDDRS